MYKKTLYSFVWYVFCAFFILSSNLLKKVLKAFYYRKKISLNFILSIFQKKDQRTETLNLHVIFNNLVNNKCHKDNFFLQFIWILIEINFMREIVMYNIL